MAWLVQLLRGEKQLTRDRFVCIQARKSPNNKKKDIACLDCTGRSYVLPLP